MLLLQAHRTLTVQSEDSTQSNVMIRRVRDQMTANAYYPPSCNRSRQHQEEAWPYTGKHFCRSAPSEETCAFDQIWQHYHQAMLKRLHRSPASNAFVLKLPALT